LTKPDAAITEKHKGRIGYNLNHSDRYETGKINYLITKACERSYFMNQNKRYYSIQSIVRITLGTIMMLGILLSTLPQPVQAASCQVYYTVKKGDKTGAIARQYGVKWIEIAAANKLEKPYTLTEGQQLCIPFKYSVSLKNNIVVKNVNNLIKVTASDFSNTGNYYVKVRDITAGPGAWYKIGKMKVPANKEVTSSFQLPGALRSALVMQVCLKNGTDDELICQTVRHIFN
jgi:LysM repeat protein